jgi:hypothetical protein
MVGAALLAAGLLAAPGQRAQAQGVSAATVTEILDSNQVYIQNRTAQVNSVAQQRQRVRTQAARASLRFSNGAVARLAHNSSLVIGQCAQLNRGTLLVNGSLNGCSASTLAGVRGTIYTLEVTEAGQTIVQVFEGEVVVGRNPHDEPVDLPPEEGDGFAPVDPSQEPVTPSVDPLVPFVTPPPELPPETPSELPPEPPPETPPEPPTAPPSTAPPPTFGPLGLRPGVDGLRQETQVALGLKQADTMEVEPGPEEGFSDSAVPDGATVDFEEDDTLTVAEGQQVIIDPAQNEAVLAPLTAEDFIALLEGPLIEGFALEIPGIGDLRRSFEQLFPGVPLPYYWVPSIPSPPVRFPFPF